MVRKSGHGRGCGHGWAHGQVLTTLKWALEPIQLLQGGAGIKTVRRVQLIPTYTPRGFSESPVHPKGKTPQPLKRHCGPAGERGQRLPSRDFAG